MKFQRHAPRYSQVREHLRRNIETGAWLPGTRLPPEIELFKQFRASNTTVMRALNDLAREGLIVRRRGSGTYVADRRHPPPIPGRTLKLGLLWFHSVQVNHWNGFCHRLSLGAFKAWGLEGVDPALDASRDSFTRGTWRQPERGLTVECLGNEWGGRARAPSLEVVRRAGYDGVLTLGIIEEAWLQALLETKVPAVVVDYPSQRLGEHADLVYANPQSGYGAAVNHFVSRGLTRIHFVGSKVWDPHTRVADANAPSGFRFGKRTDPDTFPRLSAYLQAMDAAGIEVREGWVHYQTREDTLLASKLAELPASERPQALVCHGSDQAERLIGACAVLGLHLEAAGACDEAQAGRALNIRLDTEAMGTVAGELLLARLKQPARPSLNVGVNMHFHPNAEAEPAR
ncbi:MAG: GntR family transcriptional regulator [Planctomycetota bacterium]|nr:GntR family transcriptional regulator [Planctomycetota bacterium]